MQYTFLTLDEVNGGLSGLVEYDFDGVVVQHQVDFADRPDDLDAILINLGNQLLAGLS